MGLTDAARAFLAEPRFAVLATNMPDGRIQQTVMWYDMRGENIVMNTLAGRIKQKNVQRDPRVSICLEDGYRYLSIQGRVIETIDDREIAVEDILSLARRYHPHRPESAHDGFRTQERETLIISIDNVIENGF
jgi:PPOX class probable F420-dependent enzyme